MSLSSKSIVPNSWERSRKIEGIFYFYCHIMTLVIFDERYTALLSPATSVEP